MRGADYEWKDNCVIWILKSQIKGKESENSYQELKRSHKDRHTQTHGNCNENIS